MGVITAAVLKLFPEPRSRQTALLGIATPQAACDLLGRARRRSADRVVSAEYLSRASLDLVTPDTLVVGYAFRPDDYWTIEANVEWVNWNRLGTSTLRQAFSPDTPLPFNWESNFMYGIGVTYAPNRTWAFNAGYIFIENSQPDLNFNPAVADADRHWLSAGVSYTAEDWTIDVAYQYAFSDRTVRDRTAAVDAGNLVAGDYR